MLKNKFFLISLIAGLVGLGIIGTSTVRAEENPNHPLSGLVQAITQKFGLNQSEVQSVFDQYHEQQREEKQVQMQQRLEERLNSDVESGKLTTEQKKLILEKFSQLEQERENESFANMTQEERRQELEKRKADLQSWAESQNIDPSYLMFGFGRRMGGFKNNGFSTSSPSQ